MYKKQLGTFLLVILLLFGFLVRLYRFNNPIADWHSWRQADTSSVSKNFIRYGFDLLHPRMNNISNVQSGLENPKGYFYVEFPLYNAAQASLYVLFDHMTIEEWGRIITIVMSLLGSFFLFLLIKKRNTNAAWLVLFFSLFLPFNIYYDRTILPDVSMVSMLLGGLYFFDTWTEKSSDAKRPLVYIPWLGFSLIFTAIALLLRPYALFYALPFFILAWNAFGTKLFLHIELWCFAIISVAPLLWWRHYMLSYPEGIPVNAWLFNGNGIRFRPAFFRWIFYERLTKLISGYTNGVFLATGIVGIWNSKREQWFLLSFVGSSLLYLCTIATGNVQHDYYQIVIMPSITLLMGYGAVWLFTFLQKYLPRYIACSIIGLLIFLGFWLSWQQVKDYFNINNPAIIEAGKAVDHLTPQNAKILAPYDGDSSFLYQTNRQGWASFEHDLPTLIKMGANYLVLVHPTSQDIALGKKYTIVVKTSDYLLLKLQ